MANSLLTGFSGLTTHQRMIEVAGNNLANLNTTGFKSQRATFSDVFYETVKNGSGGASGGVGGSNMAQVGTGSKLASIGRNFSQGGLEATGSDLDFAIDGEGFFVVSSGTGPFYTRAGAFAIDSQGYLVDAATGYLVQRFGTTGEVASAGPAFQTPGSSNIQLPIGATVLGRATATASLRGNLSPSSLIAQAQSLTSAVPLLASGSAATGTTLLNDLDIVSTPYASGDSISLTGTDQSGATFSASLAVDDTTTLQNLIDAMNLNLPNATARLDSSGNLIVESDGIGASSLSVQLLDPSGNTGAADFSSAALQLTVAGSDGDVVRSGLEVFDEQGNVHVVGLELRRQNDGSWRMDASLDASEGTVLDSQVSGIRLNPNGSFQAAGVAGVGDANLTFQFASSSQPQTVQINFGEPGKFTSLTSIAVASSLAAEQDGYSTGTLQGISINEDGVVEGMASNGRRFPVAELAIAMFRNPQGLDAKGNNLFRSTTSSGTVEIGPARSTGRGAVLSGQLEQSNVDIAVEFTRLIIAQRGFSANSRTITVTAEILEELTGLIR